jgi:hypothetical protein
MEAEDLPATRHCQGSGAVRVKFCNADQEAWTDMSIKRTGEATQTFAIGAALEDDDKDLRIDEAMRTRTRNRLRQLGTHPNLFAGPLKTARQTVLFDEAPMALDVSDDEVIRSIERRIEGEKKEKSRPRQTSESDFLLLEDESSSSSEGETRTISFTRMRTLQDTIDKTNAKVRRQREMDYSLRGGRARNVIIVSDSSSDND